ncbi:MAG: tetratricopeptide repeat protein [Candidatus Kapaibacterium sp.]
MKHLRKIGPLVALAIAGFALPIAAHAQPADPQPGAQDAGTGIRGGWVLLNAQETALVKAGTDAMYNLRYNEADTMFNKLIELDPNHPAGYFLLALVDWWKIVPNAEDKAKYEPAQKSFDSRIDKVLEICDNRLKNNPNDIIGLFFKGSALGYRSRLMLLLGFDASSPLSWIKAGTEGKEAYDIILQCQRLAPSNSDILLGSGLYNYFSALINDKYPIAKSVLGFLPPGDKKIGLSMLRISGQRAVYAGTEARYAMMDILTTMEDDRESHEQSLQVAKALYQQYPGNSVFERFLAKNYYQIGDLVSADSTYSDILRRVVRRDPGYEASLAWKGLYYLGDVRLRLGQYQDAAKYFQQADMLAHRIGDDEAESNWNILTNLKLGYALDKQGRHSDAVAQYKKVMEMDDYSDSHNKAKKYIAQPYNGTGD